MTYELNHNAIHVGTVDCFCLACDLYIENREEAYRHIRTISHLRSVHIVPYLDLFEVQHNIRKFQFGLYCEFCDQILGSLSSVTKHVAGDKHTQNRGRNILRKLYQDVITLDNVLIKHRAWHGMIGNECYLCETEFENEDSHKAEADHILNLQKKPIVFGPHWDVYREIDPTTLQCLTCNLLVFVYIKNNHFNKVKHMKILLDCKTEAVNYLKRAIRQNNNYFESIFANTEALCVTTKIWNFYKDKHIIKSKSKANKQNNNHDNQSLIENITTEPVKENINTNENEEIEVNEQSEIQIHDETIQNTATHLNEGEEINNNAGDINEATETTFLICTPSTNNFNDIVDQNEMEANKQNNNHDNQSLIENITTEPVEENINTNENEEIEVNEQSEIQIHDETIQNTATHLNEGEEINNNAGDINEATETTFLICTPSTNNFDDIVDQNEMEANQQNNNHDNQSLIENITTEPVEENINTNENEEIEVNEQSEIQIHDETIQNTATHLNEGEEINNNAGDINEATETTFLICTPSTNNFDDIVDQNEMEANKQNNNHDNQSLIENMTTEPVEENINTNENEEIKVNEQSEIQTHNETIQNTATHLNEGEEINNNAGDINEATKTPFLICTPRTNNFDDIVDQNEMEANKQNNNHDNQSLIENITTEPVEENINTNENEEIKVNEQSEIQTHNETIQNTATHLNEGEEVNNNAGDINEATKTPFLNCTPSTNNFDDIVDQNQKSSNTVPSIPIAAVCSSDTENNIHICYNDTSLTQNEINYIHSTDILKKCSNASQIQSSIPSQDIILPVESDGTKPYLNNEHNNVNNQILNDNNFTENSTLVLCSICQISVVSKCIDQHNKGARHIKNAKGKNINVSKNRTKKKASTGVQENKHNKPAGYKVIRKSVSSNIKCDDSSETLHPKTQECIMKNIDKQRNRNNIDNRETVYKDCDVSHGDNQNVIINNQVADTQDDSGDKTKTCDSSTVTLCPTTLENNEKRSDEDLRNYPSSQSTVAVDLVATDINKIDDGTVIKQNNTGRPDDGQSMVQVTDVLTQDDSGNKMEKSDTFETMLNLTASDNYGNYSEEELQGGRSSPSTVVVYLVDTDNHKIDDGTSNNQSNNGRQDDSQNKNEVADILTVKDSGDKAEICNNTSDVKIYPTTSENNETHSEVNLQSNHSSPSTVVVYLVNNDTNKIEDEITKKQKNRKMLDYSEIHQNIHQVKELLTLDDSKDIIKKSNIIAMTPQTSFEDNGYTITEKFPDTHLKNDNRLASTTVVHSVGNDYSRNSYEKQKQSQNYQDDAADARDECTEVPLHLRSVENQFSFIKKKCRKEVKKPNDQRFSNNQNFAKANYIMYKASIGVAYCRICHVKLPSCLKAMKEHTKGVTHRKLSHKMTSYHTTKRADKIIKVINYVRYWTGYGFVVNHRYDLDMLSFMLFFEIPGTFTITCLLCEKTMAVHEHLENFGLAIRDHFMKCGVPHLKKIRFVTSERHEFIRKVPWGEFHCGFCRLFMPDWFTMRKHLNTHTHRLMKAGCYVRLGVSEGEFVASVQIRIPPQLMDRKDGCDWLSGPNFYVLQPFYCAEEKKNPRSLKYNKKRPLYCNVQNGRKFER